MLLLLPSDPAVRQENHLQPLPDGQPWRQCCWFLLCCFCFFHLLLLKIRIANASNVDVQYRVIILERYITGSKDVDKKSSLLVEKPGILEKDLTSPFRFPPSFFCQRDSPQFTHLQEILIPLLLTEFLHAFRSTLLTEIILLSSSNLQIHDNLQAELWTRRVRNLLGQSFSMCEPWPKGDDYKKASQIYEHIATSVLMGEEAIGHHSETKDSEPECKTNS